MRTIFALRMAAGDIRSRLIAMIILALATTSCRPREMPLPATTHETALAASEPPPSPPPRSTSLPDDARQLVDQIAAELPAEVESLLARGRILYLYGQYDEALWCWEASLQLDPKFALAHEAIGHVRFNRGEFDLAADHFRQASQLDPTLDEVRLHLGESLLQLGQHREAIPVLEEQVRIQPASKEAWIGLGKAYLETDEYDRAEKSYQSALDVKQDHLQAWYGLAQVYERLGQAEKARECRERFLAKDQALTAADRHRRREENYGQGEDSGLLARAHCVAADVYALHARNTEAQNHWRQAASLDQANLACRQALGQSLARERRFAEAARIYQELCQLAPGNLNFILAKGSLEQQQGAVEQAEKTYLQATRIDPDYPNAPAALARLYLETGKDLPAARRWAERVIQLQPTAENFYFLSSACRANQDLGGARAAIKEAVRLDPSNPQYAAAARVLLKE